MGGGSSAATESKQQTTQIQQDVTSTGGGITVGNNGFYAAQSAEMSGDVEAGGVGVSGNSNSVSNANETINGLKIGDYTTIRLTQMDDNTQSVLDEAMTVMASNAANMMALAAGRDPDKPLADNSMAAPALNSQIKTVFNGFSELLTAPRILAGACAAAVVLVILHPPRKRK